MKCEESSIGSTITELNCSSSINQFQNHLLRNSDQFDCVDNLITRAVNMTTGAGSRNLVELGTERDLDQANVEMTQVIPAISQLQLV